MPDVKELIKQLGADQETAYKAKKALYEQVTRASAPGKEAQRGELAQALATELTAKPDPKKGEYTYPGPVRTKIAYLLSFVAGEPQVMALMDALRGLDTREAARFALDFAPSEASTKALVLAVDDVGPEFRIGAIGALGRRGTPEAASVLRSVAKDDPDPKVRMAAAEELARFADPANDAVIAQAAATVCKKRGAVARIRLAETLRKAGKKDAAARICKEVAAGDAPKHVKKAAEIGLKA